MEPGERVVVVAPNVPALVVGIFAAWRAGAVAVPLSARVGASSWSGCSPDAQPAAAVSVEGHGGFAVAEAVESAAQRTSATRTRIVLDQFGERDRGGAPAAAPARRALQDTAGGDSLHVRDHRRAEGRAGRPRARCGPEPGT